jgi:hypothetical protein
MDSTTKRAEGRTAAMPAQDRRDVNAAQAETGSKLYGLLKQSLGRDPTPKDIETVGTIAPYHVPSLDDGGECALSLRLAVLRDHNSLSDAEMVGVIAAYSKGISEAKLKKEGRKELRGRVAKVVSYTLLIGATAGAIGGAGLGMFKVFDTRTRLESEFKIRSAELEKTSQSAAQKTKADLQREYEEKLAALYKQFFGPIESFNITDTSTMDKTARELYVDLVLGDQFREKTRDTTVIYDNTFGNGRILGKIVRMNPPADSYLIVSKLSEKGIPVFVQVYGFTHIPEQAVPCTTITFGTGLQVDVVDFQHGVIERFDGTIPVYKLEGEGSKQLINTFNRSSKKILTDFYALAYRGPNPSGQLRK